MLEAQQGDRISGKISRKEVASVAVSALSTEASIGKPQSCLSPHFSYVGQLPVTHQQVPEHLACSFSSGTGCTWAHPLLVASRALQIRLIAVCRKDSGDQAQQGRRRQGQGVHSKGSGAPVPCCAGRPAQAAHRALPAANACTASTAAL